MGGVAGFYFFVKDKYPRNFTRRPAYIKTACSLIKNKITSILLQQMNSGVTLIVVLHVIIVHIFYELILQKYRGVTNTPCGGATCAASALRFRTKVIIQTWRYQIQSLSCTTYLRDAQQSK